MAKATGMQMCVSRLMMPAVQLVKFCCLHLLSFAVASQVPTEAEQPLLGGSHVNEDGLVLLS